MKNKSRPAVARKSVEQTTPKNVMIVDTPDGPLEIDLSDMPELTEISEDEIPDPPRYVTQSHGYDLINAWSNHLPDYVDDDFYFAYCSLMDACHYEVFNELLSSDIIDSLQSLSYLINSHPANVTLIQVQVLQKLIEERESIKTCELKGLKKFTVTNAIALQRIELLIELVKPSLSIKNLINEDECLLWAHDFSDFCEIISLLCDAKSFGDKDPINVFRILKKHIRFKTSASDSSFTSTSSTNRGRKNPLYFYELLKVKFSEAEKKREQEYGKNAENNRLKRLK